MTDFKGIEKLIGDTEYCRFSYDLKVIEDQRKNARALALVGDKSTKNEYIILVYRKSWFGLTLENSFPILEDFRISTSVENKLSLSLKSKMAGMKINLETQKEAIAAYIYSELTKVSQIAMTKKFNLSGNNHHWFAPYDIKNVLTNSTQEKDSEMLQSMREASKSAKFGQAMILFDDVKQEWIKKKMKESIQEYSEKKEIYVHCGTWNVASNDAPEKCTEWLRVTLENGEQQPISPDIYALGFQEVDMSAEAVILNDSLKGAQWQEMITRTLPENYVILATKQLVGILLCVLVKEELMQHITNLETKDVAVGLMGTLGNKGAVVVKFSLFNTSLVFMNAHLASGMNMLDRRNQDYRDVMRRFQFESTESEDLRETVLQQDLAFWIGDFNYRVNGTYEEVNMALKAGKREWLLERDQLMIEKLKGTVFEGFTEADITFDPTYKYDPKCNVYDTSEKKRVPSWCDRILWSTWSEKRGDKIDNLFYKRHEIFTSDHRPISALFKCPIRSIIGGKKNAVFHGIIRQLDRLENESMPDASVPTHSLDFGDAVYMVPMTRSLPMTNTGQVMLQWRFISKFNERNHCKSWLFINPTSGILSVGEQVKIDFVLKVDKNSAPRLNTGRDTLEDTLIIHLENGKDIFISVTGKFKRSCFGSSLEQLVCNPSCVRSSPLIKEEREIKLSIPRELWRIVDYIYHHGMEKSSLFLESGDPRQIIQIREALDTGSEFESDITILSFGETLIQFLDSLSDPVIPMPLAAKMFEHYNNYLALKQDIMRTSDDFSPVHRNVFIYIIYFLREIISHSKKERLPFSLAVIFSAILFRDASAGSDKNVAEKKVHIIRSFIEDESDFI